MKGNVLLFFPLIFIFGLILMSGIIRFSGVQSNEHKKYARVPSGYLMVLTQGDSIFNELESFAERENIPSANFTAMGFVNVVFGFFDFERKTYLPGEFNDVELVSMLGSIAWKDGKPSVHSHGVVADRDFQAKGGHILAGAVSSGSMEIMIIVQDKKFKREFQEALGADVLQTSE